MSYFNQPPVIDPRTDTEMKKYPYTFEWNRDSFRWNILNILGKPVLDAKRQILAFEDRDKAAHVCHGMNVDNAKSLGYKMFSV
jgi:hypothetical protein